MKRMVMAAAAILVAGSAHAQYFYQDVENSEMLRPTAFSTAPVRHEIVIPQVNGYTVYKADLHVHTMFSDAQATPEWRVTEAWCDGLDVIAITDHVEYRPYEKKMAESLPGYIDPSEITKPSKSEPKSDLNYPVKKAQAVAVKYGITIIPGTEITRDGKTVGHFNALFTTDNNKIYDEDPVQAIRNAKAQGALVQHNHPGWKRTSLDYTDTERKAYDAGLIDGVEVMNGAANGEFYPKTITRARERGLFVSGNTDIHRMTGNDYGSKGGKRTMTLVMAKDNSLESIREALESRRTLAYGFGALAGDEQLLKDLLTACVKVKFMRIDGNGKPALRITNCSSLPFVLRLPGKNPVRLEAFTSLEVKAAKKNSKALEVTVDNMWCGEDQHPTVRLPFTVENK